MHIVMLAAENDALPGGKVGGIGDVIRDVPPALAALGHKVSVIMPSYGKFHQLGGTVKETLLTVDFAGKTEQVEVYSLASEQNANVSFWLLEHSLFSICGVGKIYCNDPSDAPFESDATKFALFSRAAGELIGKHVTERPDAIHLHDWHTAFLAILREFDPSLAGLKSIPMVYSIHNLAIQGIRPLDETTSSLQTWFPELAYDAEAVSDPRWPSCVNPMAAAIRLSDAVHTVSPGYAQEILKPSRIKEQSYYGGEGLEDDLQASAASGKLSGILNGCDYQSHESNQPSSQEQSDHNDSSNYESSSHSTSVEQIVEGSSWPMLMESMTNRLQTWMSDRPLLRSSDYLADRRLQVWANRTSPTHLITSVGRLTEQKCKLFTAENNHGEVVLDRILLSLGHRGVFILLGTGDPEYEKFFARAAALHTNFLFLNHYSDALARELYAMGELFLMPSSFEPCGISQMLAMRDGQPCLAHAVGGLKDTITHSVTGFTFTGRDFIEQGDNFVNEFNNALMLREQQPVQWESICNNARQERFFWQDSVQQYVDRLYQPATATQPV